MFLPKLQRRMPPSSIFPFPTGCIKQDYYSSNYGDTGYLTLIFDLTNPDQPVIHVRTWQEQPDPNFGVVSPADF